MDGGLASIIAPDLITVWTEEDRSLLQAFIAAVEPLGAESLAARLSGEFDTLGALFSASPGRLSRAAIEGGEGQGFVRHVNVCAAIAARSLQQRVDGRRILTSWPALISYLRASLQYEIKEQTRILFLDKKNALIKDEVAGRGTVDHAPMYVREVIHRALDVGASAIVLVHNHPSGDVQPSRADKSMTKDIAEACRVMGIALHDHVIIGATGQYASFKQLGLI
ncbi:MAG: JAB domain-containing protein [Brevundimonas sp.]